MKKIAIITPFLARGGLEKVVAIEAAELNKYYDVTLIVLDSFIQDYPYDGKMIDIGVSLENRGIIKRINNIFLTIVRLRKIKKEHDFGLVISHGELANIPNVLSGDKTILTVHGNRFSGLKDLQSMFVNKIINFIYTTKNVQKIVTVSEGIRYSFLENWNIDEKTIVAIPNPHNIDDILGMSKESLEEFEALFKFPVLINVGRLIKEKGQWYLLRIFAELKQSNSNVKLIILGDAGLREELILLSKSLDLRTYSVWSEDTLNENYDVYFLGFQTNPFRFMAKSRLFVMTSLSEGLPNTIIEALACGLPVISTDCKSGPREILFSEMNQKTILTEPIYGKNGILMPAFKNLNFIGADWPMSEEEIMWVNILNVAISRDVKVADPIKCVDRAKSFEMNKVILEWKKLIDSSL